MKHITVLCSGLLAMATLQAAEPARPQSEEGPAVVTSPAAAQDPQVGRGNPRRPALGTSESTPAAAAPPATQPAASPPGNRGSVDRIELEATQVTGNTELPRVLHVVPWKRAELGEVGGRPARSLLDEVLEPVDREVFRRQNRYYEALRPDASQAGTRVEN